MTDLSLPDAAARLRAVTDFSSNLVVVAGAGTGKTSLLVERALSAIAGGTVAIHQMAAITFTEKAAGEMRERLAVGLERLRSLAAGEGRADGRDEGDRAYRQIVGAKAMPAVEVASRALAALEGLERARVTTIHAFCAELLRQHPVQARLAPDFQVDKGEHAEALFEAEWASFLAVELGKDAPREAAWRRLLGDLPLDGIRDVARALAGFAVPESALAEPAPPDLRALFGPAARRLSQAMVSMLARQEEISMAPRSFLDVAIRALESFQEGGLDPLRERLSRDAGLRRKSPPPPNAKLRNVAADEYKEVTREALRLIQGLAALEEERFAGLLEALIPFARAFREAMLRRGIVSFDGLLALARDLLRDHPAVRERLKRRYRMLLLDEFQDTDPLQYEIVLFLAEVDGGRARDAYDAELAAGRLFVVGDPKQSIYRFRGADYSAFVRAVARISPDDGQRLHLVANFRSVPSVLEPVNDLFSSPDGHWRPSDYQPAYEAIRATREATDDGPRVELWTIDAGDDARAEERREAEGRVLAAAIARMVEEGECGYGDVMVLLRAFTRLPLYLRALRQWNIPFVVDGGRELLERTEVVQLLTVLRALARPADPVALLGFLRSPAGGVSDAELAAYAGKPGAWDWRNRVDPGRFPLIHGAFDLLARLADRTVAMPADAALRLLVEETHLLPLSAFGYEGAQRVANLRKVAATAVELAREGRMTMNEILDALERERVADLEGESPLADETWQSVRVLTIHKAKGLENKIVFMPDLARAEMHGGFRPEGAEVKVVHPPTGSPALAIRAGSARNAASLWLDGENRLHDVAEEVRTFYVALTRARERVILFGGRSKRRAPWVDALGAWGYDPDVPPPEGSILVGGALHRRVAPPPVPPARAQEIPSTSTKAVRRWERALERLRDAPRPFAHPSGQQEEGEARRDAVTTGVVVARMERSRARARAVGRAVHRVLEIWDRGDGAGLLGPLPDQARAAAVEDGLDAAAVERDAREILETFLASPLAGRLRRVELLGREVPTLRFDGGTTWRGSIDLLYREGEEVVVADFKTDPDDTDALRRYAPQLREYGAAVRRALGLSAGPRAELWMLRTGNVIRLEAEPSRGAGHLPRL